MVKQCGSKKMLVSFTEQSPLQFLRDHAREAGLPVSGNRSDLFKRLKVHYAREAREEATEARRGGKRGEGRKKAVAKRSPKKKAVAAKRQPKAKAQTSAPARKKKK